MRQIISRERQAVLGSTEKTQSTGLSSQTRQIRALAQHQTFKDADSHGAGETRGSLGCRHGLRDPFSPHISPRSGPDLTPRPLGAVAPEESARSRARAKPSDVCSGAARKPGREPGQRRTRPAWSPRALSATGRKSTLGIFF